MRPGAEQRQAVWKVILAYDSGLQVPGSRERDQPALYPKPLKLQALQCLGRAPSQGQRTQPHQTTAGAEPSRSFQVNRPGLGYCFYQAFMLIYAASGESSPSSQAQHELWQWRASELAGATLGANEGSLQMIR